MAVRAHGPPRPTLPSMTDSGHLASPVSDGESDWQAQATLSLLVCLHHVGRRRRRRQRIPPIIPPIQSIACGQGRSGQNVTKSTSVTKCRNVRQNRAQATATGYACARAVRRGRKRAQQTRNATSANLTELCSLFSSAPLWCSTHLGGSDRRSQAAQSRSHFRATGPRAAPAATTVARSGLRIAGPDGPAPRKTAQGTLAKPSEA